MRDWDKEDWNIVKKDPELQIEYSKQYNISKWDPVRQEKLYDSQEQRELNVFLGGDILCLNANVKLLEEICSSHDGDNFRKEFMGISPIGRSIMIARMLGFDFQQITKKTKIKREEIIEILEESINKIVSKNRAKCQGCHYRYSGGECRMWGIKAKKDSYCFVHKPKHHRTKDKKIAMIKDYFHLRNCKITDMEIAKKFRKDKGYFYKLRKDKRPKRDRDFLYAIRKKWLKEGTGRIEKFETVFQGV